jgi:glycosyltransferase involved in cell wall biosynthesis
MATTLRNKISAVTVLLPVYNAQRYLAEAIQSILNQSFTDFEFLIIDDGSTDRSVSIIQSFTDPRIRLITHQKNQKLIATLNEGIKLAKAPLIARMDADDISLPDRLKQQVNFMAKHPEVILLGTRMQVIDSNGTVLSQEPLLTKDAAIRTALLVTNTFPHGSVMLRRGPLLKVGGYNPEAYLVEDYDLWVRLAKIGQVANLPTVLYGWRINPQGETLSQSQIHRRHILEVVDHQWQAAKNDPLPLSQWSNIWSREARRQADPQAKRLLAELHIHFAKGYFRHNRRAAAFWHVLNGLAISPRSWLNYVYIPMVLLPRKLFFNLEEFGFNLRAKRRGW